MSPVAVKADKLQELQVFRMVKRQTQNSGSAGQKVGNFILEHSRDVIYLSISDLAEQVGVSEATVVRFCQELGFKGYQDFKIHLSQALVAPVQSLDSSIELDDSAKTILKKVSHTAVQTIQDSLAVISPEALEAAVEVLRRAHRILFFGCGGSAIIARDANHKFLKLGLEVLVYDDIHTSAQAASLFGPDDVLFLISYSGATKDVIDIAHLAKANQAQIIALTRFGRTPLGRVADIVLPTSSPESQYRSEGVSSRVAQLCIIDALSIGIFASDQKKFVDALQKTREALSDKRW